MASRIIHYAIASQILPYFNLNQNDFILGNLLPDAHDGTLYGNSHSHFRYIINGQYTKLPHIEYERFKLKYGDFLHNSLHLGYYCHLLSDHIWVNTRIPGFPNNNLNSDSEEFIALRKIMHKDFGILNKLLINFFKLSLLDDIVVPDYINISEIDKKDINRIVSGLKDDFKSEPQGELSMLSLEFILDYINNAVSFCIEKLR